MPRPTGPKSEPLQASRTTRGFVQTGGLLSSRVRQASETRGFAESRLLTQWVEIVGHTTAAMAQPVKISYGRQGFGATLTLLTNGANAPVLQVELPKIIDRVNACYGYAAISRIRLTQTAETGFGEAPASYQPENAPAQPDPVAVEAVERSVSTVTSDDLRSALAALGRNIISRSQTRTS
jgi:hypothetical protein